MKRWRFVLAVTLAALTLCGCIPRHLFWSPDGQRAVVLGEDGLHVCDASGKLSPALAQDVGLVAWLPDSQHFIAARTTKAKTWEEAAAVLSPERRDALIKLADRLREEALAYSGDWDKFRPAVAAEMSDGEVAALILYVREHRSQGLPEKLGEKKWKELEDSTVDVHLLEAYTVAELQATAGQVLARTLDGIAELRVASDGEMLACVQNISGGEHPVARLSVCPAGGGLLRPVAEPVAQFPDWTADGRSLVYTTMRARPADAGDALQLGSVSQRRVCDSSGDLLKEFPNAEDLAGVLFWPQMKIRCLRDGRVVFSAIDVQLPATSKDMPQRASLYSIDPGRRATVARIVPRGSEAELPDGLGAGNFELSPDEARVVVSGASHGNVSVLTLATGEVQAVITDAETELKSVPAWRTAQELSLFVPSKSKWGSAGRYEVALWSGPDQARCLSCDWPDIFKQAPTSAPATTPAPTE